MFDIFVAWREAVNLGCVGLSGDEVCAGYYRIAHFEGLGDAVTIGQKGFSCDQSDNKRDDRFDTSPTQNTPPPQNASPTQPTAPRLLLPVAIWREGERFVCLVDGYEADAAAVWPLCRSNPVSYEAYVAVAEQGEDWPDALLQKSASTLAGQSLKSDEDTHCYPSVSLSVSQDNLQSDHVTESAPCVQPKQALKKDHPPLGHNQAGLHHDMLLAETLFELERDCLNWLDAIGSIKTQKQADQAGGFAERFSALEKEAEEARTAEKRPVLDQGRAIDAKWKPIVNGASEGKKRMKRALEPFLIAERERLAEQARLEGEDGLGFSNPKAGLYGRKISLRAAFILSIQDEQALQTYYAQDKRFWREKDVRQVLKHLAEADLHAGRDVPGAALVETLTAA